MHKVIITNSLSMGKVIIIAILGVISAIAALAFIFEPPTQTNTQSVETIIEEEFQYFEQFKIQIQQKIMNINDHSDCREEIKSKARIQLQSIDIEMGMTLKSYTDNLKSLEGNTKGIKQLKKQYEQKKEQIYNRFSNIKVEHNCY